MMGSVCHIANGLVTTEAYSSSSQKKGLMTKQEINSNYMAQIQISNNN